MRKRDELSKPNSCIGTAHPNEMVFVLIGRDAAAPIAIRAWVKERLRLNKNKFTDAQIIQALACADTMEQEGRQWAGVPTPAMIAIAALVAQGHAIGAIACRVADCHHRKWLGSESSQVCSCGGVLHVTKSSGGRPPTLTVVCDGCGIEAEQ